MAIIVTAILTVLQVSFFVSYPFALISFSAWIWRKGYRVVAPWAMVSAIIIDLYSSVFGSTIMGWSIVLVFVAVLSSTLLTNRSFFALLALVFSSLIAGLSIHWLVWYAFSFILSSAPILSLWHDVNILTLLWYAGMTLLYTVMLWFIVSGGKRGRKVFLVSDQML